MKVEENNIQTFCGKDLFKWESWDELDAGTLQFYGVEFCIDYLKKYNGMCVVLSIEGQLDIFSADESGNDVHEWSGFVTKIPGFLAGEKVYRVVHEYDDEFRFNVTETIAICTTEQKADEIVEENKKMGLMKTKVIGVWLKNWRDKGMPDNIWLYGFDGFNGLKTVGFVVANTDTEAEHKVWRMYNDFGTDEYDLDDLVVWQPRNDEDYREDYPDVMEIVY